MQSLYEKIKSAKKSWEGVDADKFMDEVRGSEEPATDCNELEEEIERYWRNNMLSRPPKAGLQNIARHFAKWSTEQIKKKLESEIKLAYGKVSMNPFDCTKAFEALLEYLKKL